MEEKQEKTKTDRAPHIPLVKTPEETGYERQMKNDILYFGRLEGE